MVGTVAESEDLVQEAYLRLHQRDEEAVVESPRAFLTTVVTRLAIDHLRSARRWRESYVGPWLPEPLLDDAPGPEEHAEQRETLSLAFLVLLDRLSPPERAVFLLHEVPDDTIVANWRVATVSSGALTFLKRASRSPAFAGTCSSTSRTILDRENVARRLVDEEG